MAANEAIGALEDQISLGSGLAIPELLNKAVAPSIRVSPQSRVDVHCDKVKVTGPGLSIVGIKEALIHRKEFQFNLPSDFD